MVARLGNAIYWAACIAALLWAIYVLTVTATYAHPDWTISAPIAIIGAVVIWSGVVPLAVFWLVVSINCVRDVARYLPAQGGQCTERFASERRHRMLVGRLAPSFRVEVAAVGCGQSRSDGPVLQAFKHCNRRNRAHLQREQSEKNVQGMFKCSASGALPFISVGKCCSALRGTVRGRQGVAELMSTSTGDIAFQLASARRALNARAASTLSKKEAW